MLDTDLTIVLTAFLLAGFVKGIIGMGLPTVSLSILAIAFDLITAMSLMLLPALFTNVAQGLMGNGTLALIKKLALFLGMAGLSVFAGTQILAHANLFLLSALLGFLLASYAVFSLFGLQMSIKPTAEKKMGLILGGINGFLGGMTGSFVFPGVLYLQALNLPRAELIKAMGLLFTLSTVTLGVALFNQGHLTERIGIYSALAVLPAFIGMAIGQWLQKKMSDGLFKKVFFLSIFFIGLYIIFRNWQAYGGAA